MGSPKFSGDSLAALTLAVHDFKLLTNLPSLMFGLCYANMNTAPSP